MHTRIIRHHPGSELQALGMTGPLTLELSSRWPACPPAKNSRVFLVPYRGSRAMLCSSSGVLLLPPQTGKGRPPFALLYSSRVPLSMQMQLKPQAWQMLRSVAERQAAHQDGLAVLEGEDLLSIQTVHLQEAREHISKCHVHLQQALSMSQEYMWWREGQHVEPCHAGHVGAAQLSSSPLLSSPLSSWPQTQLSRQS